MRGAVMIDHGHMEFGHVVVALCPDCNADQFPDGYGAPDRVSPAHFSVHFGRDAAALRAFLDDEELRDCVECMAGDDGWAVCYAPAGETWIGMCACGISIRKPFYVVKRGRVHVESIENASRR